MSAKISGLAWELDLPAPEMSVLQAMADHADHEGNRVFPSTMLIAWKTGYSERQVRRVVDLLESKHILVATSRQEGKATEYRIDVAAGPKKPPFNSKRGRPGGSPQPENPCQIGTPVNLAPLTSVHKTPDIYDKTPDICDTPYIRNGRALLTVIEPSLETPDFFIASLEDSLPSQGVLLQNAAETENAMLRAAEPTAKVNAKNKRLLGLGAKSQLSQLDQECDVAQLDQGRDVAQPAPVVNGTSVWIDVYREAHGGNDPPIKLTAAQHANLKRLFVQATPDKFRSIIRGYFASDDFAAKKSGYDLNTFLRNAERHFAAATPERAVSAPKKAIPGAARDFSRYDPLAVQHIPVRPLGRK